MNWSVPTIAGIQRTSAIVALVVSALLFLTAGAQVGLGCLIGGALMIANLYAWALIGRSILSLAHANQGSHPAGLVLAPLKLVILIALVYLLITHVSINLPGFMAGLLTQFAAIFIETWRVSRLTANPSRPGESAGSVKD